ncbi:STAM-binding protein [Condylostylus longicornis]|uniref:STAM-binding protein n=1 Tax=Condylostylus longicornis TaxID=2530218 RepID=UPI00244DDCEC|nr:STAM-binding protein [Condylostylus longicornis]
MSSLINLSATSSKNMEPHQRIRALSNYGIVGIDPNIPIKRYYRSGTEMVRMAHVYLQEGNHENAYILYIKFMTLFLEKIKSHPEYKTLSSTVKQPIKTKLKEVMPVTEELKVKLLNRYEKEYTQYLADKKDEAKQKEREEAAKRDNMKNNVVNLDNLRIESDPNVQPSAPDLSLLDQVVYPNDFPSGPNRRSEGLLLPDSVPEKKPSPQRPTFDRSTKPHRSESLIEGSLRTVVVPNNTMSVFLELARKNTLNNIETCGILAGKLAYHRLLITHIIIPKQSGTSDSCTTTNEEEIFDIQDQKNLITLGWIHTHPSQTAFLSSVDLHTHCSYQMMMPEAIAIVCAPKYQSSGFFMLTPNYGLDYIGNCRQSGFHPHPNDPALFMEAQHVLLDDKCRIEVVDLR